MLLTNNQILNRKVGLEFHFIVEKHMNMLHYRLELFLKGYDLLFSCL